MNESKIIDMGVARKMSEERVDKSLTEFVRNNRVLLEVVYKYAEMLKMVSRQLKGEEGYKNIPSGEAFYIFEDEELQFAEIVGRNNLINVQKGMEKVLEEYNDWKKKTCKRYSIQTQPNKNGREEK